VQTNINLKEKVKHISQNDVLPIVTTGKTFHALSQHTHDLISRTGNTSHLLQSIKSNATSNQASNKHPSFLKTKDSIAYHFPFRVACSDNAGSNSKTAHTQPENSESSITHK
jgi:hypothetical protein